MPLAVVEYTRNFMIRKSAVTGGGSNLFPEVIYYEN